MSLCDFDVIVVGAGHAGCEAALAAARLKQRTLCLTLSLDNVAMMPCNPAIGGPAKSHIVREIDALGGEMARVADAACIQMRLLNRSKGPAVHALRAQADKHLYQLIMKQTLEKQDCLQLQQGLVDDIRYYVDKGLWTIVLEDGRIYSTKAVIVASGTYLAGKVVLGDISFSSGPAGQRSADKLSSSLNRLTVELRRFKTGTPARIDARSLNYDKMIEQPGDDRTYNFSFLSQQTVVNKVACWLTYTNNITHTIIRDNFHRAPLFSGVIKGSGPRYCPSIEDKVNRFPDKDRHQSFIEPEGLNTTEMYVQGMSTSLPIDVQQAFLRSIAGLEDVVIMRPGYAIEYDCIDPLQLTTSLMHKRLPGLFFAGQVNGTSGYEEAAGQGLVAGINAANFILQKDPLQLKRSQAYIGVLIDDLVTKGTNEPYRMMTSRAEYRLHLRQDNADQRLTEIGRQVGLVSDERYSVYEQRRERLLMLKETLLQKRANGEFIANNSDVFSSKDAGSVLADLLKRPNCHIEQLLDSDFIQQYSQEDLHSVETEIKYAGYINKQFAQVEQTEKMESKVLPANYDYANVKGLSLEAVEKLNRVQPQNIGQASRISGVSPADITNLLINLKKQAMVRELNNDD